VVLSNSPVAVSRRAKSDSLEALLSYLSRFIIDDIYEIIENNVYKNNLIGGIMKTLDDMRLFAKVVELKSFTAAAENLEISRALLSKRISGLEHRLGVRLLNRTTRRLDLTEGGATYYQYCQRIIETALEAEESIHTIKVEPTGLLRVAMPILFGQDIFAPLLGEFRSLYPGIQLRMDLTDQPADLVASGYDLVVRWGVSMEDSAYVSSLISTMQVITCGSPRYLRVRGTPRHPKELESHNCLIYSPLREGHEIWRFNDKGRKLDVAVNGDIEANHATPLVKAAIAGLGLLYAPEFFVSKELADGVLTEVLGKYHVAGKIYVLFPHRMITRKERAFLDFLREKVPPAVAGIVFG
jgi:DNA-binding transcriptional LysR family regulator